MGWDSYLLLLKDLGKL